MATLVLQAAGTAVGGLFGPVGAIVGRAAGALAGNLVDQRLFGDNPTRTIGRLDDLSVQTSAEGNPIARLYGRSRLAGTVFWATEFEEHVKTSSAGGKGGGPQVKEFSYTASFAVGLCEGPIARVGRIWADGEPIDLETVNFRVYNGDHDQDPDPLIEAREGVSPAYRGLAYVVFEHLPVGPYGNRLPQLTFEVTRPVGALEGMVRAVTMIPGATEFGYHAGRVDRIVGPGEAVADNRHLGVAPSDLEASLDELQAVCPNLERIALVVAWFGDDLRAGECTLTPRVERRDRNLDTPWGVAGLDRSEALLVSTAGGDAVSYGGTPSDGAVVSAIRAIKRRGLKVVFYPFILMDVPAGNGLPDPYGGGEQSPHPWRGRITVAPAPGRDGSPDGTAATGVAARSFVGTVGPGAFDVRGGTVRYDGPDEWSLRRMMLHYASLAKIAGGVDAFLVGSELRGLTTLRDHLGYPFVDGLVSLIDDVRSIVGPKTKLSYAADWTEYFGHQAGGGDVAFHLDPLWASPNVDFVGIDNYWPLSDWREGTHLDEALADTVHDRAYLRGNVFGGEGYDYYYASEEDRFAQVRTPISDGAYGKDWVYRYKDLRAWWSNEHFDRVGGVEVGAPTAWVPQSKPVWFTEVGCPAIDNGANQPNVFYDPKSSESKLPYFSTGRRDDEMQRAYLEAMLSTFDPATSPDVDAFNPRSSRYAGRMIEPSGVHVWTWDARPWPAFPHRTDVWADGENWQRGHWVNGRLGAAPFADLVRALFADWGLEAPSIDGVSVVIDGYFVGSPSSLRSVLEPLTAATSVVGADTGIGIRFVGLDRRSVRTITRDGLVEVDARTPLLVKVREEAGNLPVEQRLKYYDSGRDFQVASARFRPIDGSTLQIEEIAFPGTLNDGLATELAAIALAARWAKRTTIRFALPLSQLALLPGDIITLEVGSWRRDVIIEEIEDLGHREITARTIDRTALIPTPVAPSPTPPKALPTPTAPIAFALNLPQVDESVDDHLPWLATYARPWPGEMGVWKAAPGGTFELIRTVDRPAAMGLVLSPPGPGEPWRWNYGAAMDVRLYASTVSSKPKMNVLSGQNALAARTAQGLWEVIQFRDAELIGEGVYRLSTLLRGVLGTDDAARLGPEGGGPLVLLNGTLASLPTSRQEVGLTRTFRVGPLGEGIGGRNVTTFDFTPTGRALKPYSPVHGTALRRPNGAILIDWIRRTREGGDLWYDGVDVPLGETSEQYRLEILSGSTVVRSVDVQNPSYTYSPAAQTADLGGAPDALSFRVSQLAQGFGPGVSYEVTVDVREP